MRDEIMANCDERCVLEGVPRVHFYEGGKRCPEDIILPSIMRAILEYLGDSEYGCRHCLAQNPDCKVLCTYAFLCSVSGAASFLSWKDGWHEDNAALTYLSAVPWAAERHILDAVGYEGEFLDVETGCDNEALFRERIMESIQRGMPALAYGIVGPPEPSLITGYDDGGEVLIGWSFFQDETTECEPSGYFRVRDWFTNTERVLIIGDKKAKPLLAETCRTTLRWMIKVGSTPMVRPEADAPEAYQQRHNGLAAYDAWIAHLLCDENWPAEDEDTLKAHHMIHDWTVGSLAEARWYGAIFLAQDTDGFVAGPGKPGTQAEVLHAAACYAAEHDLMWAVWELAGGIGNPEGYKAMADGEKRRAMVEIIKQAREQDARALAHLECALR